MVARPARFVAHADVPVVRSPSGLPTQHLVGRDEGSEALFVGQQWLQPGERVLPHTHPVDEVLVFLAGQAEATIGNERTRLAAESSLFVPADVPHGFANVGMTPLHVLVIFPGGVFAETRILEPAQSEG